MLFSRPTPAQKDRIAIPSKDQIPEEMNWIALMDRLSNGDITKHKDIYNINYIECLSLLAYWHHKDRQTEAMIRERNRK